jgi:hypothetical protein
VITTFRLRFEQVAQAFFDWFIYEGMRNQQEKKYFRAGTVITLIYCCSMLVTKILANSPVTPLFLIPTVP